MQKVAELGGAVAAIEKGFQKTEIERSAYEVAKGIDSGERIVVGLNRFRSESEERYEPLRVDPSIEADQRSRLRRCARARQRRGQRTWRRSRRRRPATATCCCP
jgi:methylmalonyl-CoA mutase N-terminal domain/subunit